MVLTHFSLFSGIGGLDIAAESAGFKTVGMVEKDQYARRVLNKHWPYVPKWEDIRDVTKENFRQRTGLPAAFIISGGFPCQPFSVAGKRFGKEDDRFLWHEFIRIVSILRPHWVVAENVTGLLSMAEPYGNPEVESSTISRIQGYHLYKGIYTRREKMLIVELCENLESEQYSVEVYAFPACGVDAQHRRDRIAIVGYAEYNGSSSATVTGSVATASCNKQKGAAAPREPARTGGCNGGTDVADSHKWTSRSADECHSGESAFTQSRSNGTGAGGAVANTKSQRCGYGDDSPHKRPPNREVNTPANPGIFSGKEAVANAYSGACEPWRPKPKGQERQTGLANGGDDVADAHIKGSQGRDNEIMQACPGERAFRESCTQIRDAPGAGLQNRAGEALGRYITQQEFERSDWWPVEPDVGRVAHGVPNRVDRLKCLGNAVVPRQFYPVFKMVAEIESMGVSP